ncbi:MAG: DegT/DnrJ/EryC1/StrS family aminotransferase [Bacteroidales bacterium]
MKPIQMVDLLGQYQKIKNEIDTAIQSVIEQGAFINGKEVTLFAQELAEYLNVKHVIPCANGTDALQIALMALDLKQGDEVITTNFTFIATVEALCLLGLKPVLVDVCPLTFNINSKLIENLITARTKVIIPVHLFGQCANMDTIIAIAKKYNLSVIEDNAQAIGAEYTFPSGEKKKSGTIGDIGCFSFFPSKNLGCYGDGGALCTNNDIIAEKLKMIVNHGSKVKYFHEIIGVNSRLDTIQAAILRIKLKKLNSYIQARQEAASQYDSYLSGCETVQIPHRKAGSNHVFHQYTIKVNRENNVSLQTYLKEHGIPSMIYYPQPMNRQKAFFREIVNKNDTFPVSENLCTQVLSLPMHTELDTEQIKYICDTILKY